jgi:hypothetical protein
MKQCKVYVPLDFVVEKRSGSRVGYNFYDVENYSSSEIRRVTNNSEVNSFINGLLGADLSNHPYIERIELKSNQNYIYFWLKKPIVPTMVIKENRKYILSEEHKARLVSRDDHLQIDFLRMQIPNSIDNELRIWAMNKYSGEISTHPNSGDDHICYGTYRDRVKAGKCQISHIIGLLNIANFDSAYRNFRYELDWDSIPSEAY